ncbi:MAG: alpha/beta fold hydrolase [Streptosporangiales bacterium]
MTSVDVAVAGGTLRVGRWGGSGPTVLALHGITANHRCWEPTARLLDDVQVVAPDLRGRGGSAELPGPFGMARHAEDAVAVLDALGIDKAVVVGHSMGGFVALVLAHRRPDRVRRLVLVDGGLPLPQPSSVDPDAALEELIGPAATRLATTFPSRAAHLEFWRAHPAFRDWNTDMERYVDYDLVGTPPQLRSACSIEAVRADTIDLATGSALPDALSVLEDRPAGRVPMLRAEGGMLGNPPGLYPPEVATDWAQQIPALDIRTVAGTNHYTILLAEQGASAVAAAVRDVATCRG